MLETVCVGMWLACGGVSMFVTLKLAVALGWTQNFPQNDASYRGLGSQCPRPGILPWWTCFLKRSWAYWRLGSISSGRRVRRGGCTVWASWSLGMWTHLFHRVGQSENSLGQDGVRFGCLVRKWTATWIMICCYGMLWLGFFDNGIEPQNPQNDQKHFKNDDRKKTTIAILGILWQFLDGCFVNLQL